MQRALCSERIGEAPVCPALTITGKNQRKVSAILDSYWGFSHLLKSATLILNYENQLISSGSNLLDGINRSLAAFLCRFDDTLQA